MSGYPQEPTPWQSGEELEELPSQQYRDTAGCRFYLVPLAWFVFVVLIIFLVLTILSSGIH